jgi:uncharacterized protein YqhQ
MVLLTPIISLIYYLFIAYIAGLLVYNFIKSKSLEKEILYIIVLIPFLLRLFYLK